MSENSIHNCFTCGKVLKGGVTHLFKNNQGDYEEHTAIDRREGERRIDPGRSEQVELQGCYNRSGKDRRDVL